MAVKGAFRKLLKITKLPPIWPYLFILRFLASCFLPFYDFLLNSFLFCDLFHYSFFQHSNTSLLFSEFIIFVSKGKIWALQYDNGEEVALLYTEKDTVRYVLCSYTQKTLQELQMLSSVTLNCQVTKIVMNSVFQLSEL